MNIKTLNYNDLAFFAGINVSEAKIEISAILQIKELNNKGMPKVSIRDEIPVDRYDFTIRSNSPDFEGKNRIKYLIDFYSQGRVDKNTLKKFAETKSFIKKIGFTSKYSILNKIMYKPHLELLQRRWLQASIEDKQYWHKNTLLFLQNNFLNGEKWLLEIGVSREEIKKQME